MAARGRAEAVAAPVMAARGPLAGGCLRAGGRGAARGCLLSGEKRSGITVFIHRRQPGEAPRHPHLPRLSGETSDLGAWYAAELLSISQTRHLRAVFL